MNKPTPEELELLHDQLCSALNDRTRIAILYELAGGSRHVSGLAAALGIPQATVSRHLRVLREGGIVSAAREANRVLCGLQDRRILTVLDMMREILAASIHRRSEAGARIRSARTRVGRGRRSSGG
ncbi:MAG: winged helix-turn-helix transcriptional regulator [Candidatus Eisenbacteria bacterium]|uniref:Winged helix-turn-helix transcriptional regulator n=1 Tax=Eiseniibacteriota bacterium TaxID=2212470 RepID=A0A937XBG9_UNCEI|nr:winged helix-turn-helix transcriptional regulator [Candidatus Eisenbacteria bacterium]